jgi:hypothetical protein
VVDVLAVRSKIAVRTDSTLSGVCITSSEAIDSDIVHACFLGTHVIFLNSAKAVHELFEKRSSIYSDRCGT